MEYKRFGNTIYLRLDPKEEILEEIGKVAKKENIRLAQVTGLGAINDFTAGVYNTVTMEYHSIQFQGAFEIVSLTGTVTRKDGDVYLHLHIAAGDADCLLELYDNLRKNGTHQTTRPRDLPPDQIPIRKHCE